MPTARQKKRRWTDYGLEYRHILSRVQKPVVAGPARRDEELTPPIDRLSCGFWLNARFMKSHDIFIFYSHSHFREDVQSELLTLARNHWHFFDVPHHGKSGGRPLDLGGHYVAIILLDPTSRPTRLLSGHSKTTHCEVVAELLAKHREGVFFGDVAEADDIESDPRHAGLPVPKCSCSSIRDTSRLDQSPLAEVRRRPVRADRG